MKYAKFSEDFLSYFRLDDNGETLVLTDKHCCTRAVKLLPYEEKPQGVWIVEKNQFGDILHCSICGARPRRSEYGYDLHDKFCNGCGAEMKGGAE